MRSRQVTTFAEEDDSRDSEMQLIVGLKNVQAIPLTQAVYNSRVDRH